MLNETKATRWAKHCRQRGWQAFLTTVAPRQFYQIFEPWVAWLAGLAVVLLGLGSVWGLAFSPPDYLQGNSYRIIFVHVPVASLALSVYLAMAILSVIFLVWQIKVASYMAQAVAPIGLMMCVLSLITGSIWAKPTWGTFWVWDARLTSMLILAFLYVGIMTLSMAFAGSPNRGKAAAILSVVGAVNLPIIKYSVIWWNTLHQGTTLTLLEPPKMPLSMLVPLLLMLLGAYALTGALAIYRTNTLILHYEQRKNWVKKQLQVKLPNT